MARPRPAERNSLPLRATAGARVERPGGSLIAGSGDRAGGGLARSAGYRRRGRLKVFLGYAPGVGKTYQMLAEAHRLRDLGLDVAIGYVETHGRPETEALAVGLRTISPRVVEFRGLRVEELDTEAVLETSPELLVVDDLAHTNAPGSRHGRRWQDVLEILDAGIDVLTTVDAYQLESLYETVTQRVGLVVAERVPDWLVAEADQLVTVDLAIEDLVLRVAEGKVVPPGRVEAALSGPFSEESLAQLRELALREAAAQAQRPSGRLRGGPAVFAPDQVMVCLSSKGPRADALLRYGSRLAGRLDRNWYAVYVQTPVEEPARLDAATRSQITETLDLARTLGATVFTYRGDEVVGTVLRFAREYGVGHVVMGKPGPRRWRDRLLGRRGPVEGLLDRGRGLTVVVVDPTAEAPAAARAGVEGPEPPALRRRPHQELAELLQPESVLFLAGSPSTEEITELLLQCLGELHAGLDLQTALELLRRREREGSTFLETGFGLPHARLPGLRSPLAAMAVCPESGAGSPKVTILLLLPRDDPERALDLLAAVARLFRRDATLEALVRASGPEDAVDLWQAASDRR